MEMSMTNEQRRQEFTRRINIINSIFNDFSYTYPESEFGEYDDIELSHALFETLNEPPSYRNVISEKGKSILKRVKYAEIKEKDFTSCLIMQTEFEDDDDVVVLPCKHYFGEAAIMRWLENEQAICPVCRDKLDSVEIKNEDEPPSQSDLLHQPDPQSQSQSQIENHFINTINNSSTNRVIENLVMNMLNFEDV